MSPRQTFMTVDKDFDTPANTNISLRDPTPAYVSISFCHPTQHAKGPKLTYQTRSDCKDLSHLLANTAIFTLGLVDASKSNEISSLISDIKDIDRSIAELERKRDALAISMLEIGDPPAGVSAFDHMKVVMQKREDDVAALEECITEYHDERSWLSEKGNAWNKQREELVAQLANLPKFESYGDRTATHEVE